MFHAFSVLALTHGDGEFPRLYDRVVHCFCNMNNKGAVEELMALEQQRIERILFYGQLDAAERVARHERSKHASHIQPGANP